ncbi:oligosaccharide flippase family protein [Gymnodinialimonas sp. 2305UL16-5]|uniref:oligosaccharide flippase family protein n=1 Tax=Gymnodinialimonas mytili TaxID=3126503 RepID=UPI0030A21094
MSEMDGSAGPNKLQRLIGKLKGDQGLGGRSRRAAFWTFFGFGTHNALRLISNLILTRLLSPEIFGLMALAQVFLQGIRMLSDVGTNASVIRSERGEDPDFLNTAWTVQVIRGGLVAAIACLIAWPIAQLYQQPVLFPIICALALTPILSGFNSVSLATVNRKLMLRQSTLAGVVARCVTVLVTILAAWWLQSVWALVIGALTGAILQLAITHLILPPFQHRLMLERSALKDIIRFGRWILFGTAFTFLADKGQQAIYGLIVPVEILGQIAIAVLLASLPAALVTRLLQQVVFPSFSEVRRNRPEDLPRILRRVRLAVAAATFPVYFTLSFFAQPLVDLLYDDRYATAGVFLALTTLNGAITMLAKPYQSLLLADGRSDLHAMLMFISAALGTLGIILGYEISGIIGSFVGVGIAFSVNFLANVVVAKRRGYETGVIDFIALALVAAFYAYALLTLDAPESLLVAG